MDIVDTQGEPQPVPTIVIEDLGDGDKKLTANPELPAPAESPKSDSPIVEDDGAGQEGVPGAIPAKPVYEIPDWYKVGWRQASGIDQPVIEGEEKDKSVLAMFLNEQFYGEWYHNAGIIIFVRVLLGFTIRR